jgi:ribosomal protein S8
LLLGPDNPCSLPREQLTNIQFLFTLTSLKYFLFLLAVGIVTCLISNQSILSSKLGYIGEFEIIDDHRSNKIVIELTGRLNKCGVISPRFDVEYGEIEKWIVNLLPSRQFGHIILSTTYGIMTHEEARRKKTGGKILGFFY